MDFESINFDHINLKNIQINILDETNLRNIMASINYRLFFQGINFEKKPKN